MTICPIRKNSKGLYRPCETDHCQWWNTDVSDCSVAWAFIKLANAFGSVEALCEIVKRYIELKEEREE
jgi:hypothetical protein